MGNLVLCDLVCAGVASPGLWGSFLLWVKRKTGKTVAGYDFRPKRDGKSLSVESMMLSDGSRREGDLIGKTWRNLFGSGVAFRPACYACSFTSLDRVGDYTLGDFWGIERVKPGLDDGCGVSLVLQSQLVAAPSLSGGECERLFAESAINAQQPALSRPHALSSARRRFWSQYATGGFSKAASSAGVGTLSATFLRKAKMKMGLTAKMIHINGENKDSFFDAGYYATGCEGYSICDNPLECTGCSACFASCPKNAIAMIENNEGFLVPRIDPDRCISCGKCRKVCPSNDDAIKALKNSPVCAYAYKNTDKVRAHSSSGGAFWALAKPVIDSGGVVYGAAFDEDLAVRHIRCTDETDLRRCCGSKYVQSDIGSSFVSVYDDLSAGKTVLFSGTPCQIAGLKSFLKLRGGGGQLILVDLLCHGAASPRLFSDHVSFLGSRHGKLVSFDFRNKEKGWHDYRSIAVTGRGDKVRGYDVAAYQELFNYSYAARPACSTCPYTSRNRTGDISLGDYWGVESHHPDIDDDKGVSLVVACTKVGNSLAESLPAIVKIGESQYDQGVLRSPCIPSSDRPAFWLAYREGGYMTAIKRFTCFGLVRRFARLSRRALRELRKKAR